MAAVLAFMEDPLVTWVRTFSTGEPVDFQELCDGVYLHDVLTQIDHRGFNDDINRVAKDSNARIKNWALFLNRLKSYYQDVLQQLIVMELPSVLGIVKDPTKEDNLVGLRKVLLLLLGCAVLCDDKERYVHRITQLDLHTQEAIVEHIKEVITDPTDEKVTDITDLVIPLDLPELDEAYRNIYRLLRQLSTERDKYIESVVTVTQERDFYQSELEEKKGPLTPPNHLEKYALIKELNLTKARVSAVQRELDEKNRGLSEMTDELNNSKTQITKLRTQNFDLQRMARSAQGYRDELDTLRERAVKADKYEKDIVRYKERINELDFYKCRVEELREDNTVLSEGRMKLEEQLGSSQKRCENIMDELVKAQLQYEDAHMEKENLQRKMQELFDENAALEFERSNMNEAHSGMRRTLSTASLTSSQLSLAGHHAKNISEELKDSVTAHLAKLEQDNDSLRHQLEELRQRLAASQRDHDKTKNRLQHELEQKIADLEQQTREIRHAKSKELTKEFETKVVEMDKQTAELKRRISRDYRQRMTGLESECEELKKQVGVLQEKWSRDHDQYTHLEKANRDLTDEKEQFKKTLSTLQESSGSKLRQLEDSVTSLQEGASVLQGHNDRISNLCVDDINRDNAKYILMREEEDCEETDLDIHSVSNNEGINNSRHSISSFSELNNCSTPQRPAVTMRAKPAKGVVAPLVRTMPPEVKPSRHSTSFSRDDKLRATVTPSRPRSEVLPFMRNSLVRQSMPNRKMMYVVPERRHSRPTTPTPRHHQSMDYIKPYTPSSSLSKEKSKSKDSFTNKLGRFMNFKSSKTDLVSDHDPDIGHATSPESPNSLDDSRDSNHLLTSISIMSSETIHTQIRTNPTPVKMTDKWKMFVNKIVDLQDKNQQLIVENSQLRRDFAKLTYATERLDKLESRNLQLEVENRKLTKIIEMLQGSGRNPHDNRLYHYYSNV